MPHWVDKAMGAALSGTALVVAFLFGRLAGIWAGMEEFGAGLAGLGGAALAFRATRRHRFRLPADEPSASLSDTTETAARIRLAWRTGRDFLNSSRKRSALPWFLSLGQENADRKLLLDTVAVPGTHAGAATAGSGFTWHFAKHGVWLDADCAMLPQANGQWALFLDELTGRSRPVQAVVVTLDARNLLATRDAALKAEAALLRRRLDALAKATGLLVPVHIMINRIDALYGMRTLVDQLPPEQTEAPLGAARERREEPPGLFASRALAEARRRLAALAHAGDRQGRRAGRREAAALQAVAELARLEKPLAAFCAEAFTPNPYHLAAPLGGVFLGTSGPEGDTVPPTLAGLPGFIPAREAEEPARAWFLPGFMDGWLPRHRAAAAPLPGLRGHLLGMNAGLAGLLAGTLLVCWLMTWNFVVVRDNLRQAAAGGEPARTAADLDALLATATGIDASHRNGTLLLIGRRENAALAGEMRRRYCDSYRELVLLPGLDRIRRLAERAARSDEPTDIGDALLAVASLRRGLSPSAADGDGAFPNAAVHAQLRAYRLWADQDEEIPALVAELRAAENRLLATAGGGDVMAWLPDWTRRSAAPAPATRLAAWSSDTPAASDGEATWSLAGYQAARTLLADAGDLGSESLDRFRLEALRYWRERTAELWRGRLEELDDDDLPQHLARSARADDPALRLLTLLRDQLLPMFPENERHPEVEWLRHYASLLPDAAENASSAQPDAAALTHWRRLRAALAEAADKCATPELNIRYVHEQYLKTSRSAVLKEDNDLLSPALSANPFAEAREAATALDARLAALGDAEAWKNLSPMASYHYQRYLATRLAAVRLDAHWRGAVFNRAITFQGDDLQKLTGPGGMLENFLADYSGFWLYGGEEIGNSSWESLPFMFNREFLDLCTHLVQRKHLPKVDNLALPFNVESVRVDREARERPVGVEIDWQGTKLEQQVVFRNYAVKGRLLWDAGVHDRVALRVVLPSLTLEKKYGGALPIGEFLSAFRNGELTLTAADFPEHREALGRLRINSVVIRVDFEDPAILDTFLRFYYHRLPPVPDSIITRGGGRRPENRRETPAISGAAFARFTGGGGLPGGLVTAKPATYVPAHLEKD